MKNKDRKLTLGKGLSALLNSSIKKRNLEYLEVSKITPNKNQPRNFFCSNKLQELAESIKVVGIIEPILVKEIHDPFGNRFEIIAGERRWRACKMINLDVIPAIIELEGLQHELEISLIENLQREDLNPIEEAKTYKKILEERSITQEDLSKFIGKSRSHISNVIRLLSLPAIIQEKVIVGDISYGQARTLLSFPQSQQYKIFQKLCKEKNISVRDLEIFSKEEKEGSKFVSRETNLLPSTILENTLNALRSFFQSKVKIYPSKNGKSGKIEISYESKEDLLSILEKAAPDLGFSSAMDVTTTGDFLAT